MADEFVEGLSLFVFGGGAVRGARVAEDVTVAPMVRIPLARRRDTMARIADSTASTEALALVLKSLMPSSQMTVVTPWSEDTSRSRRWPAEGPPEKGCCAEYSVGPAI